MVGESCVVARSALDTWRSQLRHAACSGSQHYFGSPHTHGLNLAEPTAEAPAPAAQTLSLGVLLAPPAPRTGLLVGWAAQHACQRRDPAWPAAAARRRLLLTDRVLARPRRLGALLLSIASLP